MIKLQQKGSPAGMGAGITTGSYYPGGGGGRNGV